MKSLASHFQWIFIKSNSLRILKIVLKDTSNKMTIHLIFHVTWLTSQFYLFWLYFQLIMECWGSFKYKFSKFNHLNISFQLDSHCLQHEEREKKISKLLILFMTKSYYYDWNIAWKSFWTNNFRMMENFNREWLGRIFEKRSFRKDMYLSGVKTWSLNLKKCEMECLEKAARQTVTWTIQE